MGDGNAAAEATADVMEVVAVEMAGVDNATAEAAAGAVGRGAKGWAAEGAAEQVPAVALVEGPAAADEEKVKVGKEERLGDGGNWTRGRC